MNRLSAVMAFAIATLCAVAAFAADIDFPVLNGAKKRCVDMGDGTCAERMYLGGGTVGSPLTSGLAAPAAKIVTPGTQVPFSSTSIPLQNGFLVQANPTNASSVKVGICGQVDNNVTGGGNGKTLVPGQSWSFPVNDLNLLCLQGVTAGDWADGTGN